MIQTSGVVSVNSERMWEDDSKLRLGSRLGGLGGWNWLNIASNDELCKGRK
jgi:hypothetical protein